MTNLFEIVDMLKSLGYRGTDDYALGEKDNFFISKIEAEHEIGSTITISRPEIELVHSSNDRLDTALKNITGSILKSTDVHPTIVFIDQYVVYDRENIAEIRDAVIEAERSITDMAAQVYAVLENREQYNDEPEPAPEPPKRSSISG